MTPDDPTDKTHGKVELRPNRAKISHKPHLALQTYVKRIDGDRGKNYDVIISSRPIQSRQACPTGRNYDAYIYR